MVKSNDKNEGEFLALILSNREILKLVHDNRAPIIEPFQEENLQGASYDLSMSASITTFKSAVCTLNLADQDSIDSVYQKTHIEKKGYVLKPHEYVLVTVDEKINIPVNMIAHIRPRTRFTRLGLLVASQHCNPGYSGKLSLGLYNASPNSVILCPGIHIAQIVFEELKSTPDEKYQYQNMKNSVFMGEEKFVGPTFSGEELSPEAKGLYYAVLKRMGREK